MSIIIHNFHGTCTVNDHCNFYGKECHDPSSESLNQPIPVEAEVINPTTLPDCLSSEDALRMLNIAVEQGWLKEGSYAPLISRTETAILVDCINEQLGNGHQWAPFEKLFSRKRMSTDFSKAQCLQDYNDVRKKMTSVIMPNS